ncbi:hypothetical protein HDU79_008268 [Rhizoclosmatium sp. JEL0117]|nr:hypothetical protein HDU79_008268 [Rhizoclosmatium sp. JEL0117]
MAAEDIDSSKLEKIHKDGQIVTIWGSKNLFTSESLAQAIGNPAQRHPTAVVQQSAQEAVSKPIQRQPEYQTQSNPAKIVEREKPLLTVAQVRPGPPKLYYELPAGLMCLKVPIGSMYYDSLSVNSFNSLPPPKPISNISQILKEFNDGLEGQKALLKLDRDPVMKFDSSGWETGLIDSVLNERFVERKQNPAFSKRNEEQQQDGYSSDGSASDSDNDSGNRKRKRSLTPERRWQGGRDTGFGINESQPVFMGNSHDQFDAFRSARSYNFARERRAVEPGACFRCGKQGHIAKYCDDFKK